MEIKQIKKTLHRIGRLSNGAIDAVANKQFFATFYYDYFTDILMNYFTWENLPEGIPQEFLERNLHEHGYLGIFNDPTYGLIAQRGTMQNKLNYLDMPIGFKPVPKANTGINAVVRPIVWTMGDAINHTGNGVVIMQNTMDRTGSYGWLWGLCEKLARIEHIIELNRQAQAMPYIVLVDPDTQLSTRNFTDKLRNGDPFIELYLKKNADGTMADRQLSEMVSVLNTNSPIILKELQDEKRTVINQILTKIGINNVPIDKNERLTQSESESNQGFIMASAELLLNARRKSAELLSEAFKTELGGKTVTVDINENIKTFNLQLLNEVINLDGEGEQDGEPYNNN